MTNMAFEDIDLVLGINAAARGEGRRASIAAMSSPRVYTAARFIETCPGFAPSPLYPLASLAGELGLGGLLVKDESVRFGQNAFKVMGAFYGVARYLCGMLGLDISHASFDEIASALQDAGRGQAVFYTATDGNHGRAVAYAAHAFGQRAVVFMPKGTVASRVEAIRALGADVTVTDVGYDDSVRLAAAEAQRQDGILFQDTAWEGYEEVPTWLMQGYGVIMREALAQAGAHGRQPTHVFLQAGVGTFASAEIAYLANQFGSARPCSVVMEPDCADCFFASFAAGDGERHAVGGEMDTVMAGLACGEPSLIAWPLIRDWADAAVSCNDAVAETGMRLLGRPLPGDPAIVSGGSGAVGVGLLAALMLDGRFAGYASDLGLGQDSCVLVISTEGDTDPVAYGKALSRESPPASCQG